MGKRNKSYAELEKIFHEAMSGQLASHVIDGILRGEIAILEERVVTHEEAQERMSKWLK